MYRNSVPAGIKDSDPVLVPSGINFVPAGTEVIVANRTDLFRNTSMLNLHGKTDVGCHLFRDRTC